jgi:tetratricopeptide (TPR) repeat protein
MMFARLVGVVGVLSLGWLLVGCGGGGGDEGPSLTEQYRAALATPSPGGRVIKLVEVAKAQHDAGDASGAEQSLRDAAEAAGEITDDPYGLAMAFNDIAEMQGRCRLKGKAKDSIGQVRNALDKIEDPKQRVAVLSKMALTYGLYLDNKTAAEVRMDQAKELVDELEQPADKVDGLMDLAQSLQKMEMTEQADGMVEAAIEAAKTIEHPRDRCDAVIAVASRLVTMNQKEKAVARFEEAIAATEAIEAPASQAHALAEIGLAMGRAGMYDRAEALFQQASDLAYDKVTDAGLQAEITQKLDRYRRQF